MSPDSLAFFTESLTLDYGQHRGIFDVSLTVSHGITALAGQNGAGKTTLLECLSGLRTPQRGAVRIFDQDPDKNRQAVTNVLGAALQDVTPYPTARPKDLLRFLANLYTNPRDPGSLLEQFSIPPTTVIKTMSAGQVQRLKCAMALIGTPRAVLLDEPTAGLDPGARMDLYAVLQESASDGVVMIIATHLTEDIDALADRAIVLQDGYVSADIKKSDVSTVEQLEFRARQDLPLDELTNALPAGILAIPLSNDRYLVTANQGIDSAMIASVSSWCAQHGSEATEITVGRNTLSQEVLRKLNATGRG
jgi:ABC-2 type transport system ATP-binding protein